MPYDFIGTRPVIFIHIPKTAGTIVKSYFAIRESCHKTLQDMYEDYTSLGDAVDWDTFFTKNPWPSISIEDENSEAVQEAISTSWLASYTTDVVNTKLRIMFGFYDNPQIDIYETAYKFAFVRNPWDRFSSIYHHYHSLQPDPYVQEKSFSQFVEELHQQRGWFDRSNPEKVHPLAITQVEYLTYDPESKNVFNKGRSDGRFVAADSRSNALPLDSIGRVENIEEDIEKICDAIQEFREDPYLTIKNVKHPLNYVDFKQLADALWRLYDVRPDFRAFAAASGALMRRSANKDKDFRLMYETKDLIYKVYKYYYEDVTAFDYTFGPENPCEITEECYQRYQDELEE